MAASKNKNGLSKRNKWIIGIVAGVIVLFGLVMIFGTPSAEAVFKDMNGKMLKTESVILDEKMSMKGTGDVNVRMYMDLSDSKLLAKGSFSMNINNEGVPMTFSGDLIKVGDDSYVRYTAISSSDSRISASFASTEAKLKNKWVKIRDKDQFASLAESPIKFVSAILPVPFANLNETQRKKVLDILQDEDTYTINESSQVEMSDVSAYKYLLSYDKDKYNQASKLISNYASYFEVGNDDGDEISSLTVWTDISSRRVVKLEYTGTTEDDKDITGSITFSSYNKKQNVERPSDYSIESELLD
jgi:hypothetical protein